MCSASKLLIILLILTPIFGREEMTGEIVKMNVDEYGLIIQSDGDGGDTCQRQFMYHIGQYLRGRAGIDKLPDVGVLAPIYTVLNLEILPATYVRHPYQPDFRSDPNHFSRDQQRPMVIAMGLYGMRGALTRLFNKHMSRFGKYQNNDIIGPSHFGEYIRAFNNKLMYPLLFVTDLGLLIQSVVTVITTTNNPNDVDDNNHILSLLQAQEVMPTPISYLARKIYKTFRSNGGPQAAMEYYHRVESGGNPEMAELFKPLIERM